jgi:AcrR family transcriptional regulator
MGSASAAAGNKHQQRTEATRRKLLKSARRVFARDGFEAARIEDIATDAGHTRGAFYANFESKEDLFFALLEQQAAEHISRMQESLECCSTHAQRMAALREYYVSLLSDRQWSMLMLEFKLFALRHGQLRPKLLRTHRRIRASITATKIQQLLPSDTTDTSTTQESVRRALEATLHGLVLEHAYDPTAISEEQVITFLRQIFDKLVQAHSGGS